MGLSQTSVSKPCTTNLDTAQCDSTANSLESMPEAPAQRSVDLRVSFAGLEFENPLTVASGTFASGKEYSQLYPLNTLGAVTTKGVSLNPWEGNAGVRIAEVDAGMLNSIGLQNPGIEAFIEKDLSWLKTQGVPVIVNVSGHSIEEYIQVVEHLNTCEVVSALEINISCPNVDAGGMALGTDASLVERITSALRKRTTKPLFMKLSPNVTDITEIARACEAAGADGLSLINTLLGMAINPYTCRPVLGRCVGGLSGSCIKPISLRMIWQCRQAVSLPIIGMGGVSSGLDVVEFMLAGASMVALGTINFTDPLAPVRVHKELEAYCQSQGVSKVSDLIGGLKC